MSRKRLMAIKTALFTGNGRDLPAMYDIVIWTDGVPRKTFHASFSVSVWAMLCGAVC